MRMANQVETVQIAEITTLPAFELAIGSVLGADHRRSGRSGQDGWATVRGDRGLVAVVTDGCGSGRHSEVGAVLGARLVARALSDRIEAGASIVDPTLWRQVRADVLNHLRIVVAAMGGELRATVHDHFLFTIVGVAVTPTLTAVFAIGDGVIAIDREVRELGPFPDNSPPYLAYDLLDPTRETAFALEALLPTSDVTSLAVATDGAVELAGLADLADDDRIFRNRDGLRRRLYRLSDERLSVDWAAGRLERDGGTLGDDTTVVVVRRAGEGG